MEVHDAGFVHEQKVEAARRKRHSVSSREEEKLGDRNVSSISHVKYEIARKQTNGVA